MEKTVNLQGAETAYTIGSAKNEMMSAIKAYLLKDRDGKYFYDPVNRLPLYLEGAPGIGKTEITRQIADELGIGFVSFSVTHHTRNSMIGLPVISDLENGEKYTEYTMSEIIASVMREKEKGHDEGILLLDEFNCASETIMPVMLAFLQTRNIGLYKLPDEWVIVLCGNQPEYNSNARRFTPAIMDRVRKFEIVPDADDFFGYAECCGYNEHVLSYLKLNPMNLYRVSANSKKTEVVTARGWENLSRTIDAYTAAGIEMSFSTVLQFIKSVSIASDFWRFYCLARNSFGKQETEAILNGTYTDKLIEKMNSESRAFLFSALDVIKNGLMSNAAYDKPKDLSVKISNVFRFLDMLKNGANAKEKFYFIVTDNDVLLDAVRRIKNEDYLDMARKMYGISA